MEVFSKLFKDFKNFIEDLKKKFSIKEILKKINRHRTLYPSNLSKDFKKSLSRLKQKYGEEFEYINGIHPDQLDFSSFIDNFIDNDTLADSSIDPNANANHKDIRSFMSEKGKSSDKLFGLNKIYYEIKKRWGKKTAEEWLEQEYSRGFYLNDSTTASFFPYCWANDFSRLAKEGLFFLDNYNNEAPKHLTTYFDDVIEFVSFLSNRQSGGFAPSCFFSAYQRGLQIAS